MIDYVEMHMELTARPYTLTLEFNRSNSGGCSGSIVRLPDGVEVEFSSQDCLLAALEGLCGRRVWQECGSNLTEQLRKTRCL